MLNLKAALGSHGGRRIYCLMSDPGFLIQVGDSAQNNWSEPLGWLPACRVFRLAMYKIEGQSVQIFKPVKPSA